jgi:hypothetical protein
MSGALFWAPRVLCILAIAFVSLFALDVFQQARGFWPTIAALAMHLVPSFAMIAALAVAWRWEWVGTLLFGVCAVFFAIVVRAPWWGKAIFVAPCLATARLFLLNWRRRPPESGSPN